MKTLSLLSLAALSLATTVCGQGLETTQTNLAGFYQVTVRKNSSKVVAANFVRASVLEGHLEAVGAGTLTDNDVDFTAALAGGSYFWVEITSGPSQGIATTVNSITQNTLSTEDDLSTLCGPGDTYVVRPAHTIATLFGATNAAGLKTASNPNNADTISIPDGLGGLAVIYYSSAAPVGWRNTITGTTDASGTPIYHVDAITVTRRANTNLNLTFAGTLRAKPTYYGIAPGLNYVDINYPLGSTLSNSGLQDYVKQGDSATADLVWIPNATTGYKKYFYTPDAPPLTAGWKLVGSDNTDRGPTALASGIVIERRDPATNMKIVPDPAIYGGL